MSMIYELGALRRAIQNGGLKCLPAMAGLYLRHIGWALRYFRRRTPQGTSPKAVLDFTFGPAGRLIEPSQHWEEIEPLLKKLHERQPRVVVEIGTKFGGTLAMWCAVAHPEAVIVSIDLPGGIHGGGYAYWRTWIYRRFAQPHQQLHLLRLDSHQSSTVEKLKTILAGQPIDFLFADGDHTYEGVKMDFQMYSPLVSRGGLVAFHDICIHAASMNCGVDKYWQEIRTQHTSWEYVKDAQQGQYGIGVVEL